MKNRAYFPLLMGVAAAIGLWLGSGMQDPFMVKPSEDRFNKIEQILHYVENDYVDTISRARLEDEVIAYLLQRLDPHSYYISESELALVNEPLEGNFEGIGIQFNLRRDSIYVVSVIKNGPSDEAGLEPGDIIVMVDNELASGSGLTNDRVMALLKGPAESEVNVGIKRAGHAEILTKSITRGEIPISSFDAAYLLNDHTIYIRIARFAKTTHDEFVEQVYPLLTENVTSVIMDLRGNGGGYLHSAVQVLDEFLEEDQLITYTEGKSRPRHEYISASSGVFKDVALAVLIDGFSASASEIIAGAVQDLNRGPVIGQKSFGKGLVQEQNEWLDGSATRLTVARYYTPNGRSIQRPYSHLTGSHPADTAEGGIVPDHRVSMDTAGVTWLFAELVHSGKLTKFAYSYRDKHLDRFEQMQADDFVRDVRVKELQDALKTYLEQSGEIVNERDWEASRERMALRIKAIVGRSLYGEQLYFRILNLTDPVVNKALETMQNSGRAAS